MTPMEDSQRWAPGWPGIPARWTSSAKSGVGTALNPLSRIWFTLSHGIINEIYYPRVDQACTRDMGLIVTDRHGFFSEEKRHATHEIETPDAGVPAYRMVNTCRNNRYRIVKEVIADPRRDVILQHIRFEALDGPVNDYALYLLVAPHLENHGAGNTAWLGDYKGHDMLFAQRGGTAMAVACSVPWRDRSVGFVGVSDGWQDLSRHKQMTWHYHRAENGNVALTGEVDLEAGGGDGFTVAIAFGRNTAEAGQRARASLLQGFEPAHRRYVNEWQEWQKHLKLPAENREGSRDLFLTSAAVMRIHEAKRFPGGVIASLSVPWGFSKGDNDLGGYHLVWPRDLVETAGGLLAVGALRDARQVLDYLRVTQETDGHWAQNMWLDGAPYWEGIQMDEAAFPILLVDLARREGALDDEAVAEYWPLVHRAAGYIVQNGPVTQQDRWEEDQGYSPFTLAVEIAALLAAADMADDREETEMGRYLRECADVWNANIERWTYVTDTELARQAGARGYYVRIAPPETAEASSPSGGFVPIKNRPPDQALEAADHIVSPDALALVRFGLRAPDDPRILDTIKVIDALLRVETPRGPAWRRYNDDGYGEHEDGTPFDGTGKGRAWPLLTGERGHYELAAGRIDGAEKMLASLSAFASDGGMLPEQVWDDGDIPRRELFCGRPSGSAMPLVWAHAEYVKLCRSIQERRVFDRPPQTVKRYIEGHLVCRHHIWRFNHKCRMMPAGQILRIETLAPATVVWSADGWKNERKTTTTSTGLGVHVADLPTGDLDAGTEIEFTFYWDDVSRWEGMNFFVHVLEADGADD